MTTTNNGRSMVSLISPAARAVAAASRAAAASTIAALEPFADPTETPTSIKNDLEQLVGFSLSADEAGDDEPTPKPVPGIAWASDEMLQKRATEWFDALPASDKTKVARIGGGRDGAIQNELANLKHERAEQEREARRAERSARRGG